MDILKYINKIILISVCIFTFSSCDDTKSYADLLDDENKAVNNFLANQCVIDKIPADSIFEVGANAPFYKMDEEGDVYMQVINVGNKDEMAEENQLIYFRFMRKNLNYYSGEDIKDIVFDEGNADDLEYLPTSFRFGNYTLESSYQYGSAIQLPLYYLGIGSEVNIVIKSQLGFTNEISNVIPYLYNVRYFKNKK